MKGRRQEQAQEWLDLSFPLGRGTPVFPGEPPVGVEQVAEIPSHGYCLKRYTMTGHVGTHLDAPAHVLADGIPVDQIALWRLVGEVAIVHVPTRGEVTAAQLESRVPEDAARLFVRTAEGEEPVPTRAYLTPHAAHWLVERGVVLFGMDSFSVDPVDSLSLPAHRILFEAGIPVIEMLDLRGVEEGRYFVIVAPLRMEGGDGSPVRVLAHRWGWRDDRQRHAGDPSA